MKLHLGQLAGLQPQNDTHTSVLEAARGYLNNKGAAGIMTYPAWRIGSE